MLHLRLIVPADRSGRVCARLGQLPGVTNLIVLPGVAREPVGDLVLCDVTREAGSDVLGELRRFRLVEDGSIAVSEIDTSLSRAAAEAEREAPGSPVDAVVWEEVESRTDEESVLSVTFLAFLLVATVLAAVGVLQDNPILIVGAMVVGPEFGPLAALCVAVVQRRPRQAGRSLVALLVGFPLAVAVTYGLAELGRVAGLVDAGELEATRPLTSFIWHPDTFSLLVALLAGVAGVLSLTAAKSGALIGVLISVTTVPAAGNLALALAFTDAAQARGSAVQLAVNLGALVLAGTGTLAVQRLVADRRR